jgi:hypothetical protein
VESSHATALAAAAQRTILPNNARTSAMARGAAAFILAEGALLAYN